MGFKSDIEIAQECEMLPITKIAEKAGIDDKYLEQYGKYKAKIDYNLLKESDKKDGKLILVTAINPTPAGEGKTTTTVGLADGMQKLGKSVMVALREPSLGPVFGVKGGAAGGGYAQVVPMVIWSYVLLWKKEKSTPIRLPGKNAPSKPISYSRLRSGFRLGTGNPPFAEAKSAGGK